MRKIDKTIILSTKYYEWQKKFEDNQQAHDKHSSQHNFYLDAVMNALYCQNGLCAYTERQLCTLEAIDVNNWKKGRYKKDKENEGTIDHFDSSLKSKKDEKIGRKDWLWDNLFAVHSDINTKKGTKAVDYILKPDAENYDPHRLFDYSSITGKFIAKTDLPVDEQIRINKILLDDVLGINAPNVVDLRRNLVERVVKNNDIERQFPTAQEFYRKLINK